MAALLREDRNVRPQKKMTQAEKQFIESVKNPKEPSEYLLKMFSIHGKRAKNKDQLR